MAIIELIRNCSHGSEIATYLKTDNLTGRSIIKSSSTSNGIKDLKNELEGWQWYQQKRYPELTNQLCNVIQNKKSYLKIDIKYIDGRKGYYIKGLLYNDILIQMAIKHYCDIWAYSSKSNVPLHGDLSLDNIIYGPDGLHIIDWEHFSADGAPWGFDAIYLLLESLWFGMRERKSLSKKEIEVLLLNIGFLQKQGPLPEHPLRFLRNFLQNNPDKWGKQLINFPNKFPILKFSDEQVVMIDRLILSR